MDLALNNLQRSIYHKTQLTNQPTNNLCYTASLKAEQCFYTIFGAYMQLFSRVYVCTYVPLFTLCREQHQLLFKRFAPQNLVHQTISFLKFSLISKFNFA